MADNEEAVATQQPVEETPGVISRTVYSLSYFVGFGVMFPTQLIIKSLPLDNAFGHGLCDGAQSGEQAAARVHEGVSHVAKKVADKANDTYADAAQKVHDRIERVQDALAERRFRKTAKINGTH